MWQIIGGTCTSLKPSAGFPHRGTDLADSSVTISNSKRIGEMACRRRSTYTKYLWLSWMPFGQFFDDGVLLTDPTLRRNGV